MLFSEVCEVMMCEVTVLHTRRQGLSPPLIRAVDVLFIVNFADSAIVTIVYNHFDSSM